ncbi:MAG: S-adenosyl-l-methionine hydroxide adenosyltransferase family protein [Chitinophagales bacterium]
MAIVTLTSDLGLKDFYVAILKGKILQKAASATIIDISHEIAPFNIQEAAFILKNSFFHFPEKTVHLVSVHAENRNTVKCVALEYNRHFFVGIDNGLFALMFEEQPAVIVEIPQTAFNVSSFIAKDILSDTVGDIINGKKLENIGSPLNALESKTYLRPPDNEFIVRANIVYIDRFGNLIINISKEKFEKIRAGRNFVINYKRNEELREIAASYSDVAEGERLCLFNSSGYLEIAINKGNASKLLGLHLDNTIQIEFE